VSGWSGGGGGGVTVGAARTAAWTGARELGVTHARVHRHRRLGRVSCVVHGANRRVAAAGCPCSDNCCRGL